MNFLKIFKKFNYLFDYNIKKSIFLLIVLLLLVSIFELLSLATIPAYISFIISGELNYLKLSDNNFNTVGTNNFKQILVSLMIFIFLIKALFLFYVNYFEVNLIKKIKLNLCNSLMKMYLKNKYKFFVDNNSSILSRNLITEINNAVSFIQSIITIFKEIILLLVIFFLILLYKPLLSILIILSLSTGSVVFYIFTFKILKQNSIKRIYAAGQVFKTISQSLGFIKDIKIFQKEKFFFNNYSKYINVLENKLATHELLARLPKIFFELFGVLLIIGILFSLALQDQSKDAFINLLPFLGLISASIIKLLPSFKAISGSLTHIVAYNNSFFVIAEEIKRDNNSDFSENNAKRFNKGSSSKFALEINNISFKYNERARPLNEISMKVKKNSIVGIIGKSGAGKSTLINIVLGLFSEEKGEIKINTTKEEELFDNKIVAYVPQDILILDDKLKNNIAFGIDENQINEQRVLEVIKLAGLNNFFIKNNSDLSISLGELGVKISGGEKQRIGIARALYFRPEILILDESTSSLDNETEDGILNEILKFKKNISIIMISHRLSTLKICDEIYYIEKGIFKDHDTLENLKIKYPEIESKKNKSYER